VENQKVGLVMIDSLNGYLNSMPDEKFLNLQLHELLSYLNQLGVVTILTLAQHGIIGAMQTPVDVTYLSDTVILFRYYEMRGEVRKAISVMKKRSGLHESSIRELTMSPAGLAVGEPLSEFRGILTGVPEFVQDQTL
jgi:circadian clock protein KaiC